MASALGGFQLIGSMAGGIDAVPVETVLVPSGDSDALFVGDVVVSASSGNTADPLTGRKVVKKAAAGASILGIIVGILPLENAPNVAVTKVYRPASTAQYVQIVTDKNALFRVQADDASITKTKGVGLNADLAVGAGGNVLTGASTFILDASTAAVTSTLQFRIQSFDKSPDNALPATTGVAGNVMIVSINNSELVPGQTAIAGSA
jgi:hypothetical protein